MESMSQPPPQSQASPKPKPSTSKSSLRSTGAGAMSKEQIQNQSQNKGLGLIPGTVLDLPVLCRTDSPKTVGFDESADHALEENDAIEHNHDREQGQQIEFQPFFTLISDGVTSEHYHPTVHYVFADDEEGEELVSEGVVRALRGLEAGGSNAEPRKQKEHVLILDVDTKNPYALAAQGDLGGPTYEVTQAQSLSSEWQISNVEVTSAPTMSQAEPGEEGDGVFMLRIEGKGLLGEERGAHETGREGLEGLLGRYERGLAEIQRMAKLKLGPVL